MVLKAIALLSLTIAQLAAAAVTITSPKAKDTWQVGEVVEFKWQEPSVHKSGVSKSFADSEPGKLSIAIASGPAQSLVIDRVIASNVNATKGSYKWRIPKNFNTKKKYVVEIGSNANDIAFAGYITITDKASNSTASGSHKPSGAVKPTHKHKPTPSNTGKHHESSSVCVVVPNKNGAGSTVKCHNEPKKHHGKKKPTPTAAPTGAVETPGSGAVPA
ncbi:hypothetical protein BC940DRAFT_307334 [Gongronella butleri]|nr:hypothetical protein BC940DRAFT_307334 [Gongronella butleri]